VNFSAEDELFEDLVGLFEVFGLCEAQLDYKPERLSQT